MTAGAPAEGSEGSAGAAFGAAPGGRAKCTPAAGADDDVVEAGPSDASADDDTANTSEAASQKRDMAISTRRAGNRSTTR